MIKVFSYGGGVQSTAALVLAAQGKIDYETFLFCNVGDDSEHPDTIKYVHEIAMPYAREHNIELIELQKHLKDGSTDTLYQRLIRGNTPDIPVRFETTGGIAQRSCTNHFKIEVVDKWIKGHFEKGILPKRKKKMLEICGIEEINKKTMPVVLKHLNQFFQMNEPLAQVGLGISLDEFQRVKPNMDQDTVYWKINAFPLIDLRMDRQCCMNVIQEVGLPIPSKSACWFCPFTKIHQWQKMREDKPDLFQKAVELENNLNEKRVEQGESKVWLTRKLKPLAMATSELRQRSLFDEEEEDVCESGYCFM